jgi:hypothetical protein
MKHNGDETPHTAYHRAGACLRFDSAREQINGCKSPAMLVASLVIDYILVSSRGPVLESFSNLFLSFFRNVNST